MDYQRNNGPTGGSSLMGLTLPKYLYKYAIANFDEGHEGKVLGTKKGCKKEILISSQKSEISLLGKCCFKPQH